MIQTIRDWLDSFWGLSRDHETLAQAYGVTFTGPHGSVVLRDLVDNVYCTVYEGNDPIGLAAHNAKRTLVHDILQNIDFAHNRGKYRNKEREVAIFNES